MLTGQRPFRGSHAAGIIDSILHDDPPPLRTLRPDVPIGVDRIVTRRLQKDPGARYPSAAAGLSDDLAACQAGLSAASIGLRAVLQRTPVRTAIIGAGALLLLAGGWLGFRVRGTRWARNTAHPEIARLVDQEKYIDAFRLARKVDRYAPGDVELQHVRDDIWIPFSIETDPPGADVFVRDYTGNPGDWEPLGKSPVSGLRLPAGDFCVQIRKAGYVEIEGTIDSLSRVMRRKLHRQGEVPEGMVLVPAPPVAGGVEGSAFWIDKYEVTNRQFQDFVNQGGYRRPEFWKEPLQEKEGGQKDPVF
jgi:hypothetical protein